MPAVDSGWRYWCPYCGKGMYYSCLHEGWHCDECHQTLTVVQILAYIKTCEEQRRLNG